MKKTNGPNIAGVPLREYVEALFREKEKAVEAALAAQAKAVAAALEAADKAVTKAEQNAEKWRANANEWRGAMSDRDRELPSRREVETQMASVSEKFDSMNGRLVIAEAALAASRARLAGMGEQRRDAALGTGTVLAVIGSVVGFLSLIVAIAVVLVH